MDFFTVASGGNPLKIKVDRARTITQVRPSSNAPSQLMSIWNFEISTWNCNMLFLKV